MGNQKETSDCEENSTQRDWTAFDDLFKKVVALVVDDYERWEVFDLNLPDCFHSEFGVFEDLDRFDAVLSEARSGPTDGAKVEAAMAVARISYGLRTVALGQHDEAATVLLKEVNVGIHTTSSGGTK
jgi:hypothetical protein